MRQIASLLPLTAFLLSIACAPLQPHESAFGDAGEIALRTLLAIPTLGTSELMIKSQYKMEQEGKAYQQWAQTLTPEQRLQQQDSAMRALGFALSSGGPMRTYPVQTFQPIPLPGNGLNQNQRLRSNCLSQMYGNQTMTNCQ